jgi:flavin reductase
VLCVNVLSADQQHVAARFATKDLSMDERYACGEWNTLESGAPVLADAISALDCAVHSTTEVGTHTVFFCTIEATRTRSEADALIYYARNFHRVGNAAASLATVTP